MILCTCTGSCVFSGRQVHHKQKSALAQMFQEKQGKWISRYSILMSPMNVAYALFLTPTGEIRQQFCLKPVEFYVVSCCFLQQFYYLVTEM